VPKFANQRMRPNAWFGSKAVVHRPTRLLSYVRSPSDSGRKAEPKRPQLGANNLPFGLDGRLRFLNIAMCELLHTAWFAFGRSIAAGRGYASPRAAGGPLCACITLSLLLPLS
jgi:hypothetical protein